jgi:hypothetical protein
VNVEVWNVGNNDWEWLINYLAWVIKIIRKENRKYQAKVLPKWVEELHQDYDKMHNDLITKDINKRFGRSFL